MPYFPYCCSMWSCWSATEIQHLQRLENRAARVVTNSAYDAHIKPILEKLGWKTIQQLICIQTETTTFKSLDYLAPQYLSNLLNKNSSCTSYNFRNTNADVRLPKINTTQGQKAFSFRGAKTWNSLTIEAKSASSLRQHKKAI